MADQVFSTVQIEVGRWRWLPVQCVDSSGRGVGTKDAPVGPGLPVLDSQINVSYIKYGQLDYTTYVPDSHDTQFKTLAPVGSTVITLNDSSGFPPRYGRIQLDPLGGGGGSEIFDYEFNDVSTGQITLKSGESTAFEHAAGETVLRIDWVEPDNTVAGNYLLLFTPTELDTTDLFTYQVVNGLAPPVPPATYLFEPFQNTVDIVDTGDPGTLLAPSLATCKLYGHVLDLQSAAVQNSAISARLLAVPATTNNTGLSDTTVSAKTDANGYFEFAVVQGATIDVVIPDIGYRRTIVVPSTTLAKLFELA